MKRSEAPRAGWYPDPEYGQRLRWWDGEDWTEFYRAPPNAADSLPDPIAAMQQTRRADPDSATPLSAMSRGDAQELISQIREVARSEVDRAADVFTARATTVTSQIQPLIGVYTNKVFRWLRIALGIGALVLVGWFLFQVFAQVTFFEWLGDRIDNLTD